MKKVLAALAAAFTTCASPAGPPPEPAPGSPLGAPLGVTDMDGVAYDLDDVLSRGENVALVFWQSW